MTDLGMLPDEELLVMDVLDDVSSATATPPGVATKLPLRVIYKIGGKSIHPQFLDAPSVHVISYGETREEAKQIAVNGGVLLFRAWRSQTRFTNGVVHKVVETLTPIEYRGTKPDGVFRFDATYQVFTRP